MALPDAPHTRGEMYLNAIATGDSSGIPSAPYTREEMYLDAIAKGGGGGGGSFVVNYAYGEDYGKFVTDKTWNEINAAARDGKTVLLYTYADSGSGHSNLEIRYLYNVYGDSADHSYTVSGVYLHAQRPMDMPTPEFFCMRAESADSILAEYSEPA